MSQTSTNYKKFTIPKNATNKTHIGKRRAEDQKLKSEAKKKADESHQKRLEEDRTLKRIKSGQTIEYKSNKQKRKEDDDLARRRASANRKKSSSNPSQNSGDSSSKSSSGSGITTLDDAGTDSLSGDSGSYSGSGSSDGSSSSSGTTSPLLEGSMTFEELIGEICNGIDLIFVCKRSTVVVTDYESLYAEAKYLRDNYHSSVRAEDIALWQLEDGSYELEVSEYGFYNTVIVKYKNGVVEESYDDLVRVYGKVKIIYEEPTLNKTSAIMKAKAYLAAHVRDFDMSVKAHLLHEPEIDVGDIVTLENPMTMRDYYRTGTEGRDPEYFFVMGNSISWDGGGPILNDIELRYGAKSPEKKEVPETGSPGYSSNSNSSTGSSGDVQSALEEIGKLYSSYTYCHTCQTSSCVQQHHCGDCYGMSDFLSCQLTQRGIKNKILQYHSDHSQSGTHRTVRYLDSDGSWKDFPYEELGFSGDFGVNNYINHNKTIKSTCGDN